jgi:hypothetical protein
MSLKCRQCGSARIIPEVFVMDRQEGPPAPLTVRVHGDPQAWIFKDTLYGNLSARICGDCGYTELWVKNPNELYEKYRQGLEKGHA